MEQQLNSTTGFWANDDKRDKEDFEQLSQHDAKLLVSGALPPLTECAQSRKDYECAHKLCPVLNGTHENCPLPWSELEYD